MPKRNSTRDAAEVATSARRKHLSVTVVEDGQTIDEDALSGYFRTLLELVRRQADATAEGGGAIQARDVAREP